MGHLESKTRSPVQILEKRCVCPRSHIFGPIILKLGQKFYLDEISNEFENGSCGFKTRSLGQILEKSYVRRRDLILVQILIKLGQNVCPDNFLDEYENRSGRIKN